MDNTAKKYNKAKTIKLLGLALCVFGFFIAVNISHAGVLDLAGKSIIDIFSWGMSIILYILATIFSSILMIGGWVFDWTLNLNSAILQNPAVLVGWPIARDMTNLGFVLLILIIAFSTILRMGDFTAKKALPKLIIAALLINFSLLFVGIILDFCGILTNFFINQGITGSGNGVGISQAIIGMMHIVNILQPPATLGAENFTTFGAGMLTFIANLFFINIITAITAITMWAMAAMFLIRYVMLGLLIIIMPLAILAWVIGSDKWGEWFKKFTQYAVFAPISSLFIYLAIATAQEFGAVQISAQQASIAPGLSNITANIGSMIMIIAILLFGLGLAEKISGITAVGARSMADKTMKFIGKASIKPYGLAGKAAGTGALMGGAAASERLGLSRYGIGKTGIAGMFARGVRRLGVGAEAVKETHGGLKDIPSAMIEEMSGKLGIGSRKFRLAEKQKFETEDKAVEGLAKKQVKFDTDRYNKEGAAYQTEYDQKVKAQEAEIKSRLTEETKQGKNKFGTPMERTTKEYEKRSTFAKLVGDNVYLRQEDFASKDAYDVAVKDLKEKLEKEIEGVYASTGNNLEVTKTIYGDKAKIANIVKRTGVDLTTAGDAFKKWDKDANKAMQELLKESSEKMKAGNKQMKEEGEQLKQAEKEILDESAEKIKEGNKQIKKESEQLEKAAEEIAKQAAASKKFRDDIMKK